MKLRTLLLITILTAMMVPARQAEAGESENYPVIAYAAPSERSLVSLHAARERAVYRTEESLFSGPASTDRTEEGLIVEWRERVFASLAGNLTADVADGERMVARAAVKESMKLALEHLPRLEQLIRLLKLEVNTDMLVRDEGGNEEGDEVLPMSSAPAGHLPANPVVHPRFFMKTGIRIPIEQGRPAVLSETSAVYGSVTSFFQVRLGSGFDSSLGIRYRVGPTMQVLAERRTAEAADPAGGDARRQVSNTIKLVCLF